MKKCLDLLPVKEFAGLTFNSGKNVTRNKDFRFGLDFGLTAEQMV